VTIGSRLARDLEASVVDEVDDFDRDVAIEAPTGRVALSRLVGQ
jgi:hypothetical protein